MIQNSPSEVNDGFLELEADFIVSSFEISLNQLNLFKQDSVLINNNNYMI